MRWPFRRRSTRELPSSEPLRSDAGSGGAWARVPVLAPVVRLRAPILGPFLTGPDVAGTEQLLERANQGGVRDWITLDKPVGVIAGITRRRSVDRSDAPELQHRPSRVVGIGEVLGGERRPELPVGRRRPPVRSRVERGALTTADVVSDPREPEQPFRSIGEYERMLADYESSDVLGMALLTGFSSVAEPPPVAGQPESLPPVSPPVRRPSLAETRKRGLRAGTPVVAEEAEPADEPREDEEPDPEPAQLLPLATSGTSAGVGSGVVPGVGRVIGRARPRATVVPADSDDPTEVRPVRRSGSGAAATVASSPHSADLAGGVGPDASAGGQRSVVRPRGAAGSAAPGGVGHEFMADRPTGSQGSETRSPVVGDASRTRQADGDEGGPAVSGQVASGDEPLVHPRPGASASAGDRSPGGDLRGTGVRAGGRSGSVGDGVGGGASWSDDSAGGTSWSDDSAGGTSWSDDSAGGTSWSDDGARGMAWGGGGDGAMSSGGELSGVGVLAGDGSGAAGGGGSPGGLRSGVGDGVVGGGSGRVVAAGVESFGGWSGGFGDGVGGVGEVEIVRAPVRVVAAVQARFGVTVDDVPVRRGRVVSARAGALGVRAFTAGGVVHLPAEAGELESSETQALLAHELTHVAQQRVLGAALPTAGSQSGERLEEVALGTESWFRSGQPAPLLHRMVERRYDASQSAHSASWSSVASEQVQGAPVGASAQLFDQTGSVLTWNPAAHESPDNTAGPENWVQNDQADPAPTGQPGGPDKSGWVLDPRSPASQEVAAMLRTNLAGLGEPAPAADPALLDRLARLETSVAEIQQAPRQEELADQLNDSRFLQRLADRLYGDFRHRLRGELLIDRERRGALADLG